MVKIFIVRQQRYFFRTFFAIIQVDFVMSPSPHCEISLQCFIFTKYFVMLFKHSEMYNCKLCYTLLFFIYKCHYLYFTFGC